MVVDRFTYSSAFGSGVEIIGKNSIPKCIEVKSIFSKTKNFNVFTPPAWIAYGQTKSSQVKLYNWHALEVECIGKGKADKPYEFGCKVSTSTNASCAPAVILCYIPRVFIMARMMVIRRTRYLKVLNTLSG